MKHHFREPAIWVIVFALVYLSLQIIGPRNELALIPNFSPVCYSGRMKYIEQVSDNSSCGAGPEGTYGFPFVFNYSYNQPYQNVLVAITDLLPASLLLFFTRRNWLASQDKKTDLRKIRAVV